MSAVQPRLPISAPCCGLGSEATIPALASVVTAPGIAAIDSRLQELTDQGLASYRSLRTPADAGYTRVTRTDAILMLAALNGVRPPSPDVSTKTLALGIEDDASGRLVFQTVPLQQFHSTPFQLHVHNERHGVLIYDPPSPPGLSVTEWPVSFGGVFTRKRSHHFNQSDRKGRLLPVSTISNPFDACSEACDGCSRTAIGFSRSSENFIDDHVQAVRTDFVEQFPGLALSALRYVSLMTGCQPNSEKEVSMFIDTIAAYRRAGFSPNFVVFSNLIDSAFHMMQLRDAGVFGFGSTIETVNDQKRQLIWGSRKGAKSFSRHLTGLAQARQIFPIAEATLVLGQDSTADLMRGIETLGNMGITIVGNTLRAYNETQLMTIHEDVLSTGLSYFLAGFDRILMWNAQRLSSARYMRQLGLAYLRRRKGREIADTELPYKYRG